MIDFIYEYLKKRRCGEKDKSISNEIPIKIGKKYSYYVSLHNYEYSSEENLFLNKKSLIISDRMGEITTYKRFLDKEETVLYSWKNYIRINEYMTPIIGSVNRCTIITSVQINEEGLEIIKFFTMICKKFNMSQK